MNSAQNNILMKENKKHDVKERKSSYCLSASDKLKGPRWEIEYGQEGYPESLMFINDPPKCLYGIGNKQALQDGIAVVGARRATPYGLSAAKKFSYLAASMGITVISGGAIGCDSQAHRGALLGEGITVAVLGGGCDQIYPKRNKALFQEIIDNNGAVVSEYFWSYPPLSYQFRMRNRIIAGLSRATLIVEAGLPSGTFSTADEALCAGREVLAVPGAITSPTSQGSNRLISQGATPVVDDESFIDAMSCLFGVLGLKTSSTKESTGKNDKLLRALLAQPLRLEEIYNLDLTPEGPYNLQTWIMVHLTELERDGLIVRFPDGRYGPAGV